MALKLLAVAPIGIFIFLNFMPIRVFIVIGLWGNSLQYFPFVQRTGMIIAESAQNYQKIIVHELESKDMLKVRVDGAIPRAAKSSAIKLFNTFTYLFRIEFQAE